MTADQVYQAWAPDGAPWSLWVKPVVFAHLRPETPVASEAAADCPQPSIDPIKAPPADGSTALVIDLPGEQGVLLGMALAERGYRPVPLYNALPAPPWVQVGGVAVDMSVIMAELIRAAERLAALTLPTNAPPVFLLDSRRRGGVHVPVRATALSDGPGAPADASLDRERAGFLKGEPLPDGPNGRGSHNASFPTLHEKVQPSLQFDNRSVSLPTDLPSANLLMSRGVARAVVIQPTAGQPQADLAHTLRRWQSAGIEILSLAQDSPAAQPIVVRRPALFRWLWYGVLARFGLIRGGFGGFLPEPGSGG